MRESTYAKHPSCYEVKTRRSAAKSRGFAFDEEGWTHGQRFGAFEKRFRSPRELVVALRFVVLAVLVHLIRYYLVDQISHQRLQSHNARRHRHVIFPVCQILLAHTFGSPSLAGHAGHVHDGPEVASYFSFLAWQK